MEQKEDKNLVAPEAAQAPVQNPAQDKEPTLNLTLDRAEVLDLLTSIESREEFKLASAVELGQKLKGLHKPMLEWFIKTQPKQ